MLLLLQFSIIAYNMIDKAEQLSRINKRIEDMKTERDKFLSERDICDLQYEAEVYEDNRGKLYVNTPMEQWLVEMELWRTAGLPIFDVKPDWFRTDIQKLETARYILDFFLDKENFHKEYRYWRTDKAKYGTGIFYTGIRLEIEEIPLFDGTSDNLIDAFFNNNKQKEEKKTNWFFTPKNIPIRTFLFDDRAMYQSNFDLVEDCVMIEFITKEALLMRYEWVKLFNQKALENATPSAIEETIYWTQTQSNEMVILYHYFNKIDKTYAININKQELLYDGKMPYPDGKLPFTVCQHYPRNNCIYGIWIPRKVRMSKAYKNNMMQYVIDWARLWSSKLLATSWDSVDGDIYVAPWEISIARFTNNVTDLRDIDTRVDINWPLAVLWQIDKEVRSDTGIDVQAVFEPPAEQLGTVEIIEENKQIRNKSVDELRDHAIDEAYTKVLNNITMFAPKLLKETTKVVVDWEEVGDIKTARPQIQIPNVKIEWKWKDITIEKEMWSYWYLDFEDWMLDVWLCVRVVTASTYNSTMAVIEKNKNNEMMAKYIELAQIPWMAEMLQEEIPLDQILQKRKVVYGLDDKKLVADTTLDKERKANDEKIKWIQALLTTAPNDQSIQQNQTPEWWVVPEGQWNQTTTWEAPMTGGWEQAPAWALQQLQSFMW